MVEYNRFEVKNETEDQDQSIPNSIGTLTVLRCIFGPNLESLTLFGIDLLPGQTHKPTRTTFETPKYPRRPRDQYTAQIVNTLELSAPPPNRG